MNDTYTAPEIGDLTEFLVNIRFIDTYGRLSEQEEAELVAVERARAAELKAQGHLVRMWRVPGRDENWGLWRAENPTQLHSILTSLPYWPYMDLEVHCLADHPVDPVRPSGPRG